MNTATTAPMLKCHFCEGHGYVYRGVQKPVGNGLVTVTAFKEKCRACSGLGWIQVQEFVGPVTPHGEASA